MPIRWMHAYPAKADFAVIMAWTLRAGMHMLGTKLYMYLPPDVHFGAILCEAGGEGEG